MGRHYVVESCFAKTGLQQKLNRQLFFLQANLSLGLSKKDLMLNNIPCCNLAFIYQYTLYLMSHHLHDFMVKCVIFNVNGVNFDQEQCTVTLIQRKWSSKNRLVPPHRLCVR